MTKTTHLLTEAHHTDQGLKGAHFGEQAAKWLIDRAQAIEGLADILRRNENNRSINACCFGANEQTFGDYDTHRLFLALALLAKDQTAAILNAQDVEEQP